MSVYTQLYSVFLSASLWLCTSTRERNQSLQQQRDLDVKTDAFECFTEDYVNNLPSQGNKRETEIDII